MFSRIQESINKKMHQAEAEGAELLGDFTMTPRALFISGLAIAIGLVSAFVALALLKLIGIFTNLFFFQRWSTAMVSPAGTPWVVGSRSCRWSGALIIGFMARYGSERIRGHGIPEAIEAILINGSKVEPKVAILKPLSSADFHRHGRPIRRRRTDHHDRRRVRLHDRATVPPHRSTERKTLLVAGAAAGMSATFASPWPRCCSRSNCCCSNGSRAVLIPVALASVDGGRGPPLHSRARTAVPRAAASGFHRPAGLLGCVVAGLLAGVALGAADRGGLRVGGSLPAACPSTGCGGPPSAAWSSGSAA